MLKIYCGDETLQLRLTPFYFICLGNKGRYRRQGRQGRFHIFDLTSSVLEPYIREIIAYICCMGKLTNASYFLKVAC